MHGDQARSFVLWPRNKVACQVLQVASTRRLLTERRSGFSYQQEHAPGREQVLQPPQQQSQGSTQQHGLPTVGSAVSWRLQSDVQHNVVPTVNIRPTTAFEQPQHPAGGAADTSSIMSPGPLTAAFIRLLQQHTRLSRAKSRPGVRNRGGSGGRPGSEAVLQQLQPEPQHGQDQQQQHVEQLLQYAAQLAPQLHSHQASLILYVCAKCQLPRRDPLLQALLLQLQPHQLQQLPPAGLVNTVWSLTVLSLHPGPEWLDAFYAASGSSYSTHHSISSTSGSSSAFAAYNPHQQVQLLWAAGSLPQRPPAPWVQGLLVTLQPHLKTLSPTELTNAIWGLSRIGFRPARDWLGHWFLASRQALPHTSPDCLVSQVASLGVLRVDLRSGRWLISTRSCVLQQLHAMQPQHIAAMLCGLAKRRSATPPHWLVAVLRRQTQLLSNGSSSSSSGIGGSRHQCRNVAATVWSLPLLLHPTAVEWAAQPPNSVLLRQLVSLSLPLLPECTVGELVQLAVGFARLGYYPGAHWLKTHENAVAQHKLSLTDVNRWRLRAAVQRLWKDG